MTQTEIVYICEAADVGKRIDVLIFEKDFGFSRTVVGQMIKNQEITVKNKNISKSYKACKNDEILILLKAATLTEILPQELPINVVYEDEHLIVVNKQKGMVVHPAPGNYDGTLVNALLFHCEMKLSSINKENRPGIVHRIDKDTSGLLVCAKDDFTHRHLSKQFENHTTARVYQAVIVGHLLKEGEIDAPIGRDVKNRLKMAVINKNSRPAVTTYKTIFDYNGYSYIELKLKTGRTHQIRVHLASLGHPLAGDFTYGDKRNGFLAGQCLHAKSLSFDHPVTGERLNFDSELPEYFVSFLNKLEKGQR